MPASAPEVRITWRQGDVATDRLEASEGTVFVSAKDSISITIERETLNVSVVLPQTPRPEAIVHPVATTALAILARSRGHATLHAGAVLYDGRSFAICGPQGAGKSSTLALLAQRGLPVVADDLLVVNAGEVLAGPSCVDLRADVAVRFPDARSLGRIGGRERFRLSIVPPPGPSPLGGLFLLDWSDDAAAVTPLTMSERLGVLHALDYASFLGLEAESLMDLLQLPMWRLSRPRRWEASANVLDQLIATAIY